MTALDYGGGGGTDFRPIFNRIGEKRLPISCLVFMTDTNGTFPEEAPRYPVLWVVKGHGEKVPFGTVVLLDGDTK